MNKSIPTENRKKFVEYTKNQLTGFKLKDDVLVGKEPLDRFFTGLLFPITSEDILNEDEDDYSNDTENNSGQPLKSIKNDKRYMPPSSAGFSFFITGKNIKLRVYYTAVYYESDSERNKDCTYNISSWTKTLLTDNDDGEEVEFTPNGKIEYKILKDKAKITALWRKHNEGYIVTLTLSNQQIIDDDIDGKEFNKQQNEKSLFEVVFNCIIESGMVAEYPATEKSLLTVEERDIQLRYQDIKTYAVGHGVAVNWSDNCTNKMEIWSDFMPSVEVPQVTADTGGKDNKVLAFNFLQQKGDEVIEELEKFINQYNQWIEEQDLQRNNESDKDIAKSIVENQKVARQRMRQGLKLLRQDDEAKTAFAIMNKAMLKQWVSADKNKGISQEKAAYRWRPFQLGFILMALESTANENSDYRDTLDLIWFPTGGGKTEAYLGLMVFLFIFRRLKFPASSGGTMTIMRYTLKLLTTQQFMRASKVIFALELIRQQDNNQRLGDEPFSIGLWIGASTSPNTLKQTKDILEKQEYDKLVLTSCPWCDTPFNKKNYHLSAQKFNFHCHNDKCDFGNNNHSLPCNVVDEALYQNPPSLLLATVDKFARLVWEERAGVFFGKNGNKPPELIIQDELHLISDALGSIAGLYETGIETALIARGMYVKYIASTATIKNAVKQVKTLFAKEMQLFPPSGLRYDDSYFAKTVPLSEKPGRLYVGYLAPKLNKNNCLSPLSAILLSAPIELFKNKEEFLDNWWTQLIYHGSLKGLSNSSTLYQSKIPSLLLSITIENLTKSIDDISPNFCNDKDIKSTEDFQKITVPEIKQIVEQYLPKRELTTKELSSKKTADENAKIFNALALEKHEFSSVDVALATNMVATGLDVSRLALMIINGQPLTTAEYIQASSRVGRGKTPGIVFTNFYKTQARSLSHYENFRSYHDSFYRFVEPSSVTPFTYQARKRALHAALIIAIRYGNTGLMSNNKAGDFDKNNDKIRQVIKALKTRCKNAIDNNEIKEKTLEHIDTLLDEWQNEKDGCEKNRQNMVYYENDRGSENLICNFDKENGLWKTLQSMRNVENQALVKLIPGLKQK